MILLLDVLKGNLADLAHFMMFTTDKYLTICLNFPPNVRRSSVSELALLSMSGSLLDTPDRTLENLEAGTVADNQLGSSPNLPSINIITSPMPGATVQQATSSSTPKRQASVQGQTEQQPVKQITPR